jgi:hypothetical protein
MSMRRLDEGTMANGNDGPTPQERLPDPKNILVELTLVPRSRAAIGALGAGPQYRILRTLEVDEYDTPLEAANILPLAAPRAAPTDNKFRGTSRKAAKLSIAGAPTETFGDINELIATFQDHATMVAMHIPTDAGSNRVAEENRNVRVKAFLYAASMEDDNDFHLIIGRDPNKAAKYMTVEISGLPPDSSDSFEKLDEARTQFFDFFGDRLPGTSYDFYDPPIEIEVDGSLFWDASHGTGGRPGPSKLRPKMPVVWEIHPVTKIVFEP